MNVAVIGCGYWGRKYVRVLQELEHNVLRVDALCTDGDMWNDHRRLTRTVADAAIVATPASTHAAIVCDLLSAGIPTLVEKPMALSVADAESMMAAAQKTDTRLAVANVFRFYDFGRLPVGLQSIDVAWQGGAGPRADCDVFWDMAPHTIDLCNMLFNPRHCSNANIDAHIDSYGLLILDYEEGLHAVVLVDWEKRLAGENRRTLSCEGQGWRTRFLLNNMNPFGGSEPLKLMIYGFLSGKLPDEHHCRPEDGLEVVRILEMAHAKQE